MRNFKKVLAIVLTVLFVVPSAAFGTFASESVVVVNDYWKYDSVNAAQYVSGSATDVYIVEDAPAADSAIVISSNQYLQTVDNTNYVVTIDGADVDNDGTTDYPSAVTFVWSAKPENHDDIDDIGSDNRIPLAGSVAANDALMTVTLVDYASLGWYTYDNQTAGDGVADKAFWRICGPNGAEWATNTFDLSAAPIDFSQPIEISSFSEFDDFQNDWINGVVINGTEYIIPGCGNAFNGFSNSVPNGLDSASFGFSVGALTNPYYAPDGTVYGIGGVEVETNNPDTQDGHNHAFGEFTLTTPQTCVDYAVYTAECAICGETITKLGSELNEHTWDAGVITRYATCNKTEKTTYTCTVCGGTKEETTGEKLEHNYVDIDDPEINKAPTCTEPGAQRQECDQREPHHFRTLEIPALGHNVETWTEVTPGTCLTPSVEEGVCTRCQEIIQREGSIAGHANVLKEHEGVLYNLCTVCGNLEPAVLDSEGTIKGGESYGDGMLQSDFWTIDVNDKVGTNMGIGAGYDDWLFTDINADGSITTWDTNFAFRDYPATASANTRMVSKFSGELNGFSASIVPVACWIDEGAALKFPYAQNYSFFWTNNPEAYRAAQPGVTSRGFIKDGSNYDASDRSFEVLFADTNYDLVADLLAVDATFEGTAYRNTYEINIPFTDTLTVSVVNTDSSFVVTANGVDYAFNYMIGAISGPVYFGAQASTDWTNNAAVRALSTDFTLASINGSANVAEWHGDVDQLDHDWDAGVLVTAGDCVNPSETLFTCSICGGTKTEYGEVGGHALSLAGVHEGVIYDQCSICGELVAGGSVADLDGEGNIVDDGDNYVSSNANGDPTIVQNDFWTVTGVNADGTDLGIGNGYNNWFVSGIDANGNVFIKDEAQFFNDQPAASRAQSLIVSKFTTSVDGFTTAITPLECLGANNNFTKFAQNYSVLFTNHPELYRDGKLVTQGFEGFIRSDDGVTHPADEMSFEIVLWNNNLDDTVTYVFVPSVVNGVVDNAINTMTALSAAAPLTANLEIGVSTENGLKITVNGNEYDFSSAAANNAVAGAKYVGYQAGNSWNASQFRIMSARFVVAAINGAAGTATWHGEELPHVWGEWVVGETTKTRTCELCGATETEDLPVVTKDYVLTFDANGGKIDGEDSVSFGINYGETYGSATGWETVHVPVRDGYTFDGWSYLGVYYLTNLTDTYGLQSDGTFVAEWIENKEVVDQYLDMTGHAFTADPQYVGDTFNSTGIAGNGGIDFVVVYDDNSTEVVKNRSNKKYFDYFLENGTQLVNGETVITDAMIGTHTITVVANEEGYEAFEGTATLTFAPAPKDYEVTFDANGGLIEGEPSKTFGINNGESYESATGWATVPVPVREGYTFDGWWYEEYNYLLNNMQETYGVTWSASFTAHWIENPPEPEKVVQDGMTLTLTDVDGNIKDAMLITDEAGAITNYQELKAAKETAAYFYRVTAIKLGAQNGVHVFTVPAAGNYTLLVRYTDSEEVSYYSFVISADVDVTVNGQYATVTVTGGDVKNFRFAPGAGLNTVAEIKAAAGYYGVVASSFNNGTYTTKKLAINTYSYVVELVDGTKFFGEFTTEEAPAPVIPIVVDITATGISNWEGVSRVKYAPGELTTAADFRGAQGLKVIYAPADVNDIVEFGEPLTGTYSFQVIFTDGHLAMTTYTFLDS